MKVNKNISFFLSIILTVVYLSYSANILNSLYCKDTIPAKIVSNYIHINLVHLLSNLVGLYFLSEIEEKIGSHKFLILILFLTLSLSACEYIFFKSKCSIGISGILYGLVAYEMFKFKDIDYNVIGALVTLFLFGGNSKISHSGHLLGFIVGVISTLFI